MNKSLFNGSVMLFSILLVFIMCLSVVSAGDVDDNVEVDDDLVHEDGKDYLIGVEDDIAVAKNPDNTVNFTDNDYAEHGVAEVVNVNGEHFVVVFWAKDVNDIDDSELISELNKFNRDNNVKAVAF